MISRERSGFRRGRAAAALTAAAVVLMCVLAGVASAAPPANDDFIFAYQLPPSSGSVVDTTAEATRQTGEPDHCVVDPVGDCHAWIGDHSVWYRWTAPNSGPTTIDTCTANIDSILAVYTGSDLASLTRVTDNNNSAQCGGGFGSVVAFDAVAGTTYRIAIGDAGGARENAFILTLVAPAPPPPGPDLPSEPQPKADGTLTIDANKGKVEEGRKVTLSGQYDVATSESCESNRSIQIQRRLKSEDDSMFATFASVNTDTTGNYTLKTKIKKTYFYRAVVAETDACDDETSNSQKVRVQKKKAAQEA